MAREPFNRVWAENPAQFEEPDSTTWELGWEGGANKNPPSAAKENWWHNRVDFALRQLERDGAMEWLDLVPYSENGLAISPMGDMYASQVDENEGNDPDSDGGENWLRISFKKATTTVFGFFRKATQEEVDDGSTDEAAVTPEKLRFGFSVQLSANGYIAFPSWLSGLMIQWGTAAIEGGERVSTNFPTAFPNECFQAVACDNGDGNPSIMGVDFTESAIIVETNETSGVCRYIAIGH